jgi:hypothetical protein
MPRPDEVISWLAAADGVAPIDAGWFPNSGVTGPSIVSGAFRPSTTGADDAYVVVPFVPTDDYVGDRSSDIVELQFRFTGVSNAPSWTAAGAHVAFIDDGVRALGLAIGPLLELVDPYTGDVVAEVSPAWPWQRTTTLLFRKLATERWQVLQDGVLLAEVGYAAAPETVPIAVEVGAETITWSGPRIGWGRLDTAGDGDGRWDAIEIGVNLAVPRQWLVDRTAGAMAPAIRSHWSRNWEALTRTILGEAQQAKNALEDAWPSRTPGRVVIERASFSGAVLPTVEDVQWSVVGSAGDLSIVAERVRFAANDADTGVTFAVTTTTLAEYRARATFIVHEAFAFGLYGRVGPALQIRDGTRRVTAQMVWSEATQTYGWILHDGAVSGGALGNVGRFWPVNPWVDHVVELRVLQEDRVILFVDSVLVDDLPYSTFTGAAGGRSITIGKGDDTTIELSMSVSHGLAEVAHTDPATRPAYLQALAEQLLFVGGREPNYRLGAWSSYSALVNAFRGSLMRLRNEYRRIAGHDDIDIHRTSDPPSWYLDRTYPGITPVYLDAEGKLVDAYIEFKADIPNYTPEAFCDLIHTYLAPISLVEVTFHCALVTELESTVVNTTVSTFTVEDTHGFAAGDAVELREATQDTIATVEYLEDDDPAGADAAWVAVEFNGEISGRFRIDAPGLEGLEYLGSFSASGLDGDQDGAMPGLDTVTVTGAGAGVDCRAWAFGATTLGVPVWEEFAVLGTTPAVGAQAMFVCYGLILSSAQPDDVTVESTTLATSLFTVDAGDAAIGGGCLSFDTPLQSGPSTWVFVADGATTAFVLMFGIDDSDAFVGERITLAGTTPVESTTRWKEVRVVSLAKVAAGITVTVYARASDRTAVARLVSDSAADTGSGWLVGYDLDDQAQIERFILDGTTPVDLTDRWKRITGVRLVEAAVGTVTVQQANGTLVSPVDLTLLAVPPGERTAGYHLRQIPVAGSLLLALDQVPSEPRTVLLVGYDAETLELTAEAVPLDGTDWVAGHQDWQRLDGISTGHIPTELAVAVLGDSFLTETVLDASQALNDGTNTAWELTGLDHDDGTVYYLAPSRGTATGLRDLKSERHSTGLPSWPVRYHTGKAGSTPSISGVQTGASGQPVLVQTPSGLDQVNYPLADPTDLEALWASGTFTIFFRYNRFSTATTGIYHVLKADGGTAATAEQVGINGLTVLRCRYNGVNHTETVTGSNGTWYSAALVMVANSSQWYKDGVAVGTPVAHGGAGTATLAQLFRNIATSDGVAFADLAIYQRELTSGEVATLDADAAGTDVLRRDPDLFAHYLDPGRAPATAYLGGPVDLAGEYDTTEATTLQTLDSDTNEVTTDLVTGFTSAAVLRKILD